MSKITKTWAREILDSRGVPTVEAACQLDTGQVAVASVPTGAAMEKRGAVELRDEDPNRLLGKGVLKAVANVNDVLGPGVWGMDAQDQAKVDARLIELDGTPNKTKYGANAILAVSVAACKAAAQSANVPLYIWVSKIAQKAGLNPHVHIPIPVFNMINGGLHGAGNLDFQEFHVIPASSKSFSVIFTFSMYAEEHS